MSQVTKSQGEEELSPHYVFFVNIHRKAFDDWKNVSSLYPTTGAHTRACFINDRLREYTRANFPPESIIERSGRFFLHLNKIAGRYKKLKNSRPSNIPTQEELKLEDQQLELGEALEPLTLVNIGYIPNKAFTEFRFEISCVKGKKILWYINIPLNNTIEKNVEISESDIQNEQIHTKRVHKKAQ